MTVTELCTLVTRAEFRPFDKSDYDGWINISTKRTNLNRWQVRMELV